MPSNAAMHDPNLAIGFNNLASLFAPPSAADAANYADAALKKQKLGEIAQLFQDAASPGFNKDVFDRQNIVAGNYTPVQGYYAQDQNTATDLAKNAADNQQKFLTGAYGTVAQDAIRPDIPASIASMFGVNQDLPQVNGQRSPLSETQVKGNLLQQQLPANPPPLTDAQTIALTMGTTPVENIVTPNGPRTVYRPNAVGQEPAYAPNATIMSDGLPKPPEGAVWKTGPDGKPILDDRGAPIAIPYQGGPLFQKQQAADKAAVGTGLQQDLVLNTIGTAIDSVKQNPNLTTGVGAQLTGAVGGMPANDVANTLNTIKANISFDKLQALRQASPTGGALGNVSDNDMKLLQATYGSLEQSQSAPQLLKNLETFRQVYYDTINGPGAYAAKQQADAATAPPLPPGVTEDDIQHTMQIHGMTREQVLARLGST